MKRMIGMTFDEIRQYPSAEYIDPARQRGATLVEIRVGDMHAKLRSRRGLISNGISVMCRALGAARFEQQARVKQVALVGPYKGAGTTLVFELLDDAGQDQP